MALLNNARTHVLSMRCMFACSSCYTRQQQLSPHLIPTTHNAPLLRTSGIKASRRMKMARKLYGNTGWSLNRLCLCRNWGFA